MEAEHLVGKEQELGLSTSVGAWGDQQGWTGSHGKQWVLWDPQIHLEPGVRPGRRTEWGHGCLGLGGTNPGSAPCLPQGLGQPELVSPWQWGWGAQCPAGSRHTPPASTVLPGLAETATQ